MCVSGVDYPNRAKNVLMSYMNCLVPAPLSGRALKCRGEGEDVPTLIHLWRGANWLERETWDMFGIQFAGHPQLAPPARAS